jgi:hypothetical protein
VAELRPDDELLLQQQEQELRSDATAATISPHVPLAVDDDDDQDEDSSGNDDDQDEDHQEADQDHGTQDVQQECESAGTTTSAISPRRVMQADELAMLTATLDELASGLTGTPEEVVDLADLLNA